MPLSRNVFKQGELDVTPTLKKIETLPQVKKVVGKKLSVGAFRLPEEQGKSVSQLKTLEQEFHQSQVAQSEAFERQFAQEKASRQSELTRELAEKKASFLAELADLKKDLLAKITAEGDQLKAEAVQQGLSQGHEQGYEAGLEQGLAQANDETKALKKNGADLFAATKLAAQNYQQQKQAELINLAQGMAEKILQKEIQLSEAGLFSLLEPFLNQLNTVENFVTVYVRSESVALFQEKLEELKAVQPSLKYVVLVDNELEENGCVMETEYEVLDLQIGKQLKAMVTMLNEVTKDDDI